MQKIVTIGGGTGQYQILRGLRNYECDICAVVNVFDNGGSSGELRDEFGILPPGDLRQCMVALAGDDENSGLLREMFNDRSENGKNFGNLFIMTATKVSGGEARAMKRVCKLLNVKGRVLPVSIDNVALCAETLEGKILEGQTEVSYPQGENVRIKRIYHNPEAFVFNESAEAIRDADKIVICPGDLYRSILSNLIVSGVPEAIRKSGAMKVYVCNLFTKEGTQGVGASGFIEEIERYAETKLDKIIIDNGKLSGEVLDKYLSEKSKPVEDDVIGDSRVLRGEFVAPYTNERKTILRHVPEKIARAIISL